MANIERKLKKISQVFRISDVLSTEINMRYIQRYYDINEIPYKIFHTRTDNVHMGITRGKVYTEDDLFEAPRIVAKFIRMCAAKKVLELAMGKGANSRYLANEFSNVSFVGTDISKHHLKLAKQKATQLRNFVADYGDFHNLNNFKSKSFDLVFIVEALCHAEDKYLVLNEVHRLLKEKGFFVVIDGYTGKALKDMTKDEVVVKKLIEVGMAIKDFGTYSDFIAKSKKVGFKVKYEEDVSSLILPTLHRFERLAKGYFKFPFLAKSLKRVFPKEFVYNAITGYLFPDAMEIGLGKYMITVLQKD